MRFPADPLVAAARSRGMTDDDLAARMGVTLAAFRGWRRRGVPLRWADAAAVAVGRVPGVLWDDWDAASLAAAEAVIAAQRERWAAEQRRKYAELPGYAERQRAKVERWKADNPEAVKQYHAAYQRAWTARQGDTWKQARAEYQRAYRARRAEREAS